jgi:hypothetical protein
VGFGIGGVAGNISFLSEKSVEFVRNLFIEFFKLLVRLYVVDDLPKSIKDRIERFAARKSHKDSLMFIQSGFYNSTKY